MRPRRTRLVAPVVIAMVFFASGVPVGQPTPPSPVQLARLERAVRLNPGRRDARIRLANAYLAAGRLEHGLAIYREWAHQARHDPLPRVLAAKLVVSQLVRAKKPEPVRHQLVSTALSETDAALAIDPDNREALAAKAQLLWLSAAAQPDRLARERLEQRAEAIESALQVRWPSPTREFSRGAHRVGGSIPTPRKTRHVDPIYPPQAQASSVEGTVVVELRIDETGTVSEARVLRSVPLLDQAALEAVRQWRFTPTFLDNAPVPVVTTAVVTFDLR